MGFNLGAGNIGTYCAGCQRWVQAHKRQQGQSKRWSYSQVWTAHNKSHCFSGCHFPLQTLFLVSPSFLWHSFPFNLKIPCFQFLPRPRLPPRLPPFVGWLGLAVTHYSSWRCQSLSQPLPHKLQLSLVPPTVFKWILLAWSEGAHSPPTSLPLCFCFEFTSQSFVCMIQ